ncbi:MAG: dihydroorotate oxidase [Candidatus Levybacteria bacterium]|nr:dihydroorotate oxidase [Candidatus Levybacteria bacterium]
MKIQQNNIPFYDPEKSYEENFNKGPFGAFTDGEVLTQESITTYDFLGHKVATPFGIPAGPLINGRFVKAALDKGFDLPVYKTVRTRKYACAPWPNVLAVKVVGDLTPEKGALGLIADHHYEAPIAITNSFGVPSFDPDFWQKDMKEAVAYAKPGQIVIGSFQGTTNADGDIKAYIKDFADAARLVKETGAKVLEVNLSCPNEGTAHLLCFDLERTQHVVSAIKNEIGDTPLIIKIAYFKEQEQLLKLINAVGKLVQGISAINTIPSKIIDKEGNQALPGEGRAISGVCGAPIKWAGLEMVERLKRLREADDLDFAIIGVGGVIVPQDYTNFREAGSDAVMSATGAMWNPFLAQEIKSII